MAPGAGPQGTPKWEIAQLPPGTAATSAATERMLVAALREVCLPGLSGSRPVQDLAASSGARAVPDPWKGTKFFSKPGATTWSWPETPRAFLWMAPLEHAPDIIECVVLAYDGRHEVLARTALDTVSEFVREQGLGPLKYPMRPLADLQDSGGIDGYWVGRDLGLSISLDYTNPAETGLQVSVRARWQGARR